MKYRKKPIIIEAWQLTEKWLNKKRPKDSYRFESKLSKDSRDGSVTQLHNYIHKLDNKMYLSCFKDKTILFIHTLEGDMRANVGDWIIKGVNGEIYPCKPDIFKKTYDKL